MTQEELQDQEKTSAATVTLTSGTDSSTDYSDTMTALRQQQNALPVFSSSYDNEISELFNKIVNRRSFSYSPGADPVYGAYRDQYTREGKLAMRNSMGQAAALTGGYGSSYSAAVGQQEYDSYLQKLNEVLPELYSNAYEKYSDEGESLMEQYKELSSAGYQRYRDDVTDMQYQQQITSQTYDTLSDLIFKTGYQPSSDELSKAGMSSAQADALRNEFLRLNGLLPTDTVQAAPEVDYYTPTVSKETVKLAAYDSSYDTSKNKRS